MKITPELLKMLRVDIDKALAPVAAKFGVTLAAGNATYTEGTFTIKVSGGEVMEDGTIVSKEAEDFKRYAKLIGFEPTDLGRQFEAGGKQFVICGYAPKKSKFPVLAKNLVDGKTYKFGVDAILLKFKMQAKK